MHKALVGVFLLSGLCALVGRGQPSEPLPNGAVQRLGSLTFIYADGIGDLCYLPDGRVLLAVGSRLEVWNMAEGRLVAQWQPVSESITSLDVNRLGTRALIGTGAGTVAEVELTDGGVARTLESGYSSLRRALYSPDEQRVLTTHRRPPRICEFVLQDSSKTADIEGTMHYYHEAVYSADGTRAYVDGGNGSGPVLAEYDLREQALLKAWHKDYYTHARSLVLSPDGERLLLGSRHMATEWRLADRHLLRKFTGHHGHAVTAVAYGHDPDHLLTGSRDGSIRLWNRLEGTLLLRWFPHNRYVTRIEVSPDGRWVLSYGSGTVAECSIQSGEPRLDWDRHTDGVQDAAWLPGGERLVSVSSDATWKLWDAREGTCMKTVDVPGKGGYAVAISPAGTRCAVGCKDGNVREFTIANGTPLRTLKGHRGYIRDVVFTADGTLVSVAGDGALRTWPAEGESPATVLTGHQGGILAVAGDEAGTRYATGGRDGTVRLWDPSAKENVHVFKGHHSWVQSVAFGTGGTLISAGLDGQIIIWHQVTGDLVRTIDTGNAVLGLACLPGGLVVCGHRDGSLSLWRLQDGTRLASRHAHANGVASVAVTPDGGYVVTSGLDGSLLIWAVAALR